MKRSLLLLVFAAFIPFALGAQQVSAPAAATTLAAAPAAAPVADPVSTAVRNILDRQSKNLIAATDEMPADKYSFKPTPAQNSFGHLVVHMTNSNFHLCSMISGVDIPKMDELKETDSKDTLTAALKSSFAFCTQALAKVDDSKLGEVVMTRPSFSLTRAYAMIALTNDFADHYSAAAMYLRLNGLLPPSAQPHKD